MRMKLESVFWNPVRFMKRFLLSSLLVLAMGGAAVGQVFENDGNLVSPPDNVQIDAPVFINNGTFSVDMTAIQSLNNVVPLFSMSDNVNATNAGTITGIPGFDFENFPASVG